MYFLASFFGIDEAWGNAKFIGNALQCITFFQSNASNV